MRAPHAGGTGNNGRPSKLGHIFEKNKDRDADASRSRQHQDVLDEVNAYNKRNDSGGI